MFAAVIKGVLSAFVGQLYGLEKFWAFLKYSRRNVNVDPKLKQWLSKYQRLEDFRVDVSNNNNTHDNVYSAVIMTTGHCESSLGSFDECRPAPSSRRPSDQAT